MNIYVHFKTRYLKINKTKFVHRCKWKYQFDSNFKSLNLCYARYFILWQYHFVKWISISIFIPNFKIIVALCTLVALFTLLIHFYFLPMHCSQSMLWITYSVSFCFICVWILLSDYPLIRGNTMLNLSLFRQRYKADSNKYF